MVVLSVFLMHLLCSSFDCDYLLPYPSSDNLEIQQETNRSSRSILKVDPVVLTYHGGFEGYFMKVVSGREIFAFEGIPYAEPPVGNNRFRDPVPKRPWNEIRPAKKPGPDCLQMSVPRLLRITGSENCLFLNIYSSQIPVPGKSMKKLPVIIFLHGGNFFFGAGREYGPSYLLKEQVVLVTINYRLGPLGFLSTGDRDTLGNWGLKDQALAISWVSENIEFFGGNKEKITLTGQSAGAVNVHQHMLSTTSIARGLFSRAVSFSGSSFNHWGLQTPEFAKLMTTTVAKNLGCPTDRGNKAMVDCLRLIDASLLTGTPRRVLVGSAWPLMYFAPVIEPNVTEAFITAPPEFYYENDLVMKVPYWCTNMADESSFLHMTFDNLALDNYYIRNWRNLMPILFDYGRYIDYPMVATEIIGATYFGPDKVSDNGLRMDRGTFFEIGSDRYFTVGNRRTLRAHSKIAPTYSYIYHFRSESSMATRIFHDFRKWNATHTDDMPTFFNCSLYFLPLKRNTPHFELSTKMTNLLANFADKGVPLLTRDDGTFDDVWKPIVGEKELQFLEIGPDASFKMVPESADKTRKLKAWDWLGL